MPGKLSNPPTLIGWVLRDLTIFALAASILTALSAWEAATGWLAVAVIGGVLGFVIAYALTYILHEWGHWVGATLTGSDMPFAPYKGALIGYFSIADHSPRQFVWLSWGGVFAYVLSCAGLVSIYLTGTLGTVGGGLAVGGLAFLVQALAVDVPQILKVQRGADALKTNQTGATGAIILRRTWQTWIPLTTLLGVWHLAT